MPAFSGEKPSTSCRYSEKKNHIANVRPRPAAGSRLRRVRLREWNSRSGISGACGESALDQQEHEPAATTPETIARASAPTPSRSSRSGRCRARPATARGRAGCAGEVEVAGRVARCGPRQESLREERRGQADRNVDEQDPAPAEQLGEHPAEQDAGGTAGTAHRAPDPDGAVALGGLGERGRDHRQRRRRDHGRGEALRGARDDQDRLAVRHPAHQRVSANIVSPVTNTRRRPSRSAARPPSSRKPANVTV